MYRLARIEDGHSVVVHDSRLPSSLDFLRMRLPCGPPENYLRFQMSGRMSMRLYLRVLSETAEMSRNLHCIVQLSTQTLAPVSSRLPISTEFTGSSCREVRIGYRERILMSSLYTTTLRVS